MNPLIQLYGLRGLNSATKANSPLFEIARVLVRFDHVPQLHRKRGSQRDVIGFETSRSQLRC